MGGSLRASWSYPGLGFRPAALRVCVACGENIVHAKKKLDILLISRSYPAMGNARSGHIPGGVETHVEYLANELIQISKGPGNSGVKICNVHILTVGRARAKEGRPPNLIIHRLSGANGHFSSKGEVPLEKPVSYCMGIWHKIRPDVIHAHDFEGVQISMMLKMAFGTPVVITIHRPPRAENFKIDVALIVQVRFSDAR